MLNPSIQRGSFKPLAGRLYTTGIHNREITRQVAINRDSFGNNREDSGSRTVQLAVQQAEQQTLRALSVVTHIIKDDRHLD